VIESGTGSRAAFVEGWHHDPFGRHESRFHDGRRWTPYVKDGETHALDEPVDEIVVNAAPEILSETVLVVEVPATGEAQPFRVYGRDGRDLGEVRPVAGDDARWEVLGGDGVVALTLTKARSIRRSVTVVRDGRGAEMGRMVEQRLPGVTTYALESSAGGNVGFVRARTWAGWDVRVEDEQSRPLVRVSQRWDGLDRAAFPVEDAYVARVEREMPDPQRALAYAAALGVDAVLKRDGRGFG
jgi:hypothetical protein